MNNTKIRERRSVVLMQVQPKKWSHQDELHSLIGKTLRIVTPQGVYIGKLLAADAYTLKLDLRISTKTYAHVIFSKSAMTYYTVSNEDEADDLGVKTTWKK